MNPSRILPILLFTLPALAAAEVPAAVVAGATVTMADLDRAAADRLRRLQNEAYGVRRQALEDSAFQLLTEKEAAARGVPAADLLQAEVDAKVHPPSDAEKRKFYAENKARLGDKPYEEVEPSVDGFLRQQAAVARRSEFLRDLKARHGMAVFMEPLRADVGPSDDPSRGPKDAPVLLVEFSDYQCPYCAKMDETVRRLQDLYGPSLRVVFRDFPLSMHKDAPRAAEAAACAGEQGKFWAFHELLFANQDKLSDEGLSGLAAKAGLKKDVFAGCLASGRQADEWKSDAEDGRKAGVSGTPTLFVNGRFLFGNLPFETLVQAVDDELLRLGRPLPGTGKAAGKPGKGKK